MANNDFFGVYDHFKFNYYFFNSSTEEAICDMPKTLEKHKDIDLSLIIVNRPKSCRAPQKYIDFIVEEFDVVFSLLRDMKTVYNRSGIDDVVFLLSGEISRIEAVLDISSVWINPKCLKYDIAYRILHIIYYTFHAYFNSQNNPRIKSIARKYKKVIQSDDKFFSDLDKIVGVLETIRLIL